MIEEKTSSKKKKKREKKVFQLGMGHKEWEMKSELGSKGRVAVELWNDRKVISG